MKETFAKILGWRPVAFGRNIVGRFLEANAPMHAAGLTYFSLLAIVPILCCVLVLAKACGVDRYARDQVNAQLDALIVNLERGQDHRLAVLATGSAEEREVKRKLALDLGQQARNISQQLFGRIDDFDVGTFGWIGFGFLLWTVISSLGMAETSFNEIWGVAKPRPIWKRAYVYLFVMVVLPALAAVAMSLPILNVVKHVIVATAGSSAATRWLSDGLVTLLDSSFFRLLLTLLSGSVTFGFVFWLMPNARVCLRHAWVGGAVTTVLFGGWIRLCTVAQVGIAKTSALYGSFAFLPIMLAWVYMSWQIVLLGTCFVRALSPLLSAASSARAEACSP